jgi:hypothetical protein
VVFFVTAARVGFVSLIQPVAADLGVTAAALDFVASAAWLDSAAISTG